jgi:pilus assembly protein CpaF
MFLQSSRHTAEKNGTGHADPLMHAETLEAEFQRMKTGIHRELLDSLDLSRIAGLSEEELREDIRHLAEGMLRSRGRKLPPIDEERLVDELIAESFGLGPLEHYMQDPDVTDILVNGPNEVYVERLGRLQETNTVFADEEHLLQIIQRVAARVGRRIDEHSPMVDARLADGSRVNAIVAPLAVDGSLLSIRKFAKKRIGIDRLIELGSVPEAMAEVMRAVVRARRNVLISGGTGSGKTTLLNAMSSFVDERERIVTIEDSAELQLQQEHVARLETRPPNIEGKGEVTQRDLVKNALRMRPDRIIVGEVRAGEAFDMLQAMNTGHDGSMTTVHANTPRDALSRVEQMIGMSGIDMTARSARAQIASAINVVIQVGRLSDGRRRVLSLSELTGMEGDTITMQEIYRFKISGRDADNNVIGRFEATGIRPKFLADAAANGIELNAEIFRPDHGLQ